MEGEEKTSQDQADNHLIRMHRILRPPSTFLRPIFHVLIRPEDLQMLSCTRRTRASAVVETVGECSDTVGDIIIPFGSGFVCCLRPIYRLHVIASRLVRTKVLHYDVVHARCFGGGDKMDAVVASTHSVDLIACAIEIVEKMPVCITRLLAEDVVDLGTFSI
jgi:hypothetical protein